MMRHEIERESRWILLGRAMGRGLYPLSIFSGAPWRVGMWTPYGADEREARRRRRQSERMTP
jgi:hypothetical protein